MNYTLTIGDKSFSVELGEPASGRIPVTVNGKAMDVIVDQQPTQRPTPAGIAMRPTPAAGPNPLQTPRSQPNQQTMSPGVSGQLCAPIPGLITDVRITIGEVVQQGQWIATMEAMKMENQLTAPVTGTVTEIAVQKGSEVHTGQLIIRIG